MDHDTVTAHDAIGKVSFFLYHGSKLQPFWLPWCIRKKSGFNLAKKLYFSWISFHYYILSFAKLCLFLLICPNIKSLLDVLKKISSFSLVTEMLFQERILLFHVPKWPF